jgi:hypothetical protein
MPSKSPGPRRYVYTWEKLFNALNSLVEGPDPIQERLVNAMMSAYTVMAPHRFEEAFPPDARPHAKAIYERMTAIEGGEVEGSFGASA